MSSVLWVANASADVSIGSTTGSLVGCGSNFSLIQSAVSSPGLSFSVPTGDWVLSSWSTQASSGGGQMAAVIYRQTSPGVYTVVGTSAVETLTPNVVNTFATAIQVQAGDLLGLWATAPAACGLDTGNSGDILSFWSAGSLPSVGDTTTSGSWSNDPTLALDISATLVATGTNVNRLGYCSAPGNTYPDGTPIPVGTFLNLAADQPATDLRYSGAMPAFYYEGLGISCDRLPGYTATGELVGYGGHGDDVGGIYTYMASAS
jgi:hypothetical protein